METTDKGLQSFLKWKIDSVNESLKENKEALMKSFNYEFEWRTKSILVEGIKLDYYKQISEYGLKAVVEDLKKYTSRAYNVMGSSTCHFRNIKTAVEFETKLLLLEELKFYL